MPGIVPSVFPGGFIWVYITGIALIAASVSIMTGIKTSIACLLLILMLVVFILSVHMPGLKDEATRQMTMISLLKDIYIAIGALVLVGISDRQEQLNSNVPGR
jgi:putative oxidoreductase